MLGATERASAAAQRLFEIIDRQPTVHRTLEQGTAAHREISGHIDLDRVSFYHGNRQVLKEVSLNIRAKTLVGIVGHTGSGKSTLANLLCRFYETEHGEVRIDGTDIRRLPLTTYRSQVGIVLQDPFLFYGGIRENISFGRRDASPSLIIHAARSAMAHEFILRLPNAYDTAVGERGQALSGGERQRVAIARALIMDPKILILDEATSAVDPETERKIKAALDSVAVGRTVVAIAHRLSTLRHADTIFVLNQGRLVESGTHDALLTLNGEYARLWAMNTANAHTQTADPDARAEKAPPEPERVSLIPEGAIELTYRGAEGLMMSDTRMPHNAPFQVHPRRCFPISEPNFGLAFVDNLGRERAFVAEMETLAPPVLDALCLALNDTEWFPRIEHILRIHVQTTSSAWHVVTNRGTAKFVVTDEEKVRWVQDDCYALTDEHGTTYVIPSLQSLDRASRRRFQRFSA
jgi:ATP-binding cassette subfamily B protein